MITLFAIYDMIKMLGIVFFTIIVLAGSLGLGYWLGDKVYNKFFANKQKKKEN